MSEKLSLYRDEDILSEEMGMCLMTPIIMVVIKSGRTQDRGIRRIALALSRDIHFFSLPQCLLKTDRYTGILIVLTSSKLFGYY